MKRRTHQLSVRSIAFTIIALLGISGCRGAYDGLVGVQVPKEVWLARLHQAGDEAQVIDVRFPAEYAKGHIEGALNMSFIGKFASKANSLDRDKPTFIYCETAHRSPFATRKLKKMGFKQVIDLKSGYAVFRQKQ